MLEEMENMIYLKNTILFMIGDRSKENIPQNLFYSINVCCSNDFYIIPG